MIGPKIVADDCKGDWSVKTIAVSVTFEEQVRLLPAQFPDGG